MSCYHTLMFDAVVKQNETLHFFYLWLWGYEFTTHLRWTLIIFLWTAKSGPLDCKVLTVKQKKKLSNVK